MLVDGVAHSATPSSRLRFAGRQHWQTVEGGLEEAKTAQAALVVRKGRGERIEPTRLTFEQTASRWLESKTKLRTKTRAGYQAALKNHLLPVLGQMKIHAVSEDDIARLVRQMDAKGLKPWTIRGQALTPLSGIFRFAVRKDWRSDIPVVNLEADERPRIESREKRILEVADIHALIEATPAKYRPVIQTAVFTGLRLGELLGLRWGDVDLARGVLRVRWQMSPLDGLSEPKTATSKREVVVFPELANILREQRFAPTSRKTRISSSPRKRERRSCIAVSGGAGSTRARPS